MGTFHYEFELAAMGGAQWEIVDAMVDTGATYSWVPRDILERLGIHPTETSEFILADGKHVTYPLAWVQMRIDGKKTFSICVFGEPGSTPLLGAFALEGLRLAAGPFNKRLIPVPGYLLRTS